MIAIIDYNVGNLLSACKAFEYLGVKAAVTNERRDIEACDGIVLPGVGAFPDAMEKLRQNGLDEVIKAEAGRGKPLLGICLGMQLLFESSEEIRRTPGLGLIKGAIKKIQTPFKMPHMGWNSLSLGSASPLFDADMEGAFVYFVHSFCACPERAEDVLAMTDYGGPVCAAAGCGNVYGVQFHPEKSSRVGLRILKNFAGLL